MFPSTLEEAILSDERVFERFEQYGQRMEYSCAGEREVDEGNW